MDALQTRLAAQGGVASVRDLGTIGVTPQHVQTWVRDSRLVRIRRDAVVEADLWNAAPPWERHALRARAVMLSLLATSAGRSREADGPARQSHLALSHHSSLSLQGIPVFGVDDLVHMVRTDGRRGRSGSGLRVHANVDPAYLATVDGLTMVIAPLACLQVADTFGVEAGLVSADALLREEPTPADLTRALAVGRFGRGGSAARTVAELADARMESAGESRTRWVMRVCGLPEPEPQVVVRDAGQFLARVDFLFAAERTIVEFDGMLKYQSPEDLRAEKYREDRLRQMGYEVVRLTWADLANPARVNRLILDAFARAARSRAS
ncbi:MAG: hypothetical protein WA991_06250 [Ornithinimicrobium sp.]